MSLRSSALWALVLLLAPAGLPQAAAHTTGAPTDGSPVEGQYVQPDTTTPSPGYTGPGRAPYINFYQGAWVYGQVSASPLGQQLPKGLVGSGDWIVWQDAASNDVFAYSIPAGTGQYLTRDKAIQRSPAISGNTVVWEDYRNNTHADVYAYFLDTGETRRVSAGPGNHLHPSVDGPVIAWEDDRDRTGDIWGFDLRNGTEFPIFVGPDRESDPLVLGDTVYFRTYRFNVWDVMAVNLTTGELKQITSDLPINGAPFTNGRDVFFLTQYFTAWSLDKYDPRADRIEHLKPKFLDTSPTPTSGDRLVEAVNDLGYRQLVAENLTTGTNVHVTGNLLLTSEPWLQGLTAYAPVRTPNGTTLLTAEISPFAFTKAPTVSLLSPKSGVPWLQPVAVSGLLRIDGNWSQPATFTYRVDDGLPIAIPYQERFRFTLDPAGVDAGQHAVAIRATFREGPPVEATIVLTIPKPGSAIDVKQAGQAYQVARVYGVLNTYLFDNPASWFILAIALLLLVLVAFRLWLVLRPKRRGVVIEYVAPPE